MSKQQIISMLDKMPNEKLNTVFLFTQFIFNQPNDDNTNTLLSENALAKDWLSDEEDKAWQDL